MEVLTLLVKAKSFEQIIAGEKKEEARKITPASQAKYIDVTPQEVTIKLYNAIRFMNGNEADAPEALVEIVNTELEYVPDEDGYIQLYEEDGRLLIEEGTMIYTLGKIIHTKNMK